MLWFLKNVRIFLENVRELGSQVPYFLHVCIGDNHKGNIIINNIQSKNNNKTIATQPY